MSSYQDKFLQLAIERDVLRFGRFELKSGRISPYFFNAGKFSDGESLALLGEYYAEAIVASGIAFDLLFGPAYKGIPLSTSIAVALYRQHGRNVPVAYNRKETKDHGEGGNIVGARLAGRVLIVDDVISAGTSIRESLQWIHAAGAELAGVAIALDRQERGEGPKSAVQELEDRHRVPVISISSLNELIAFLEQHESVDTDVEAIKEYRKTYGV